MTTPKTKKTKMNMKIHTDKKKKTGGVLPGGALLALCSLALLAPGCSGGDPLRGPEGAAEEELRVVAEGGGGLPAGTKRTCLFDENAAIGN